MTEIMAKYSREEVSKNNGINGSRVWIIIRNDVIDVTDQLNEHPGGREVIMEHAGKDATKAFEGVGHSSEAEGYAKGAKIGELTEEDKSNRKARKVDKTPTEVPQLTFSEKNRSCLSIICCGMCG